MGATAPCVGRVPGLAVRGESYEAVSLSGLRPGRTVPTNDAEILERVRRLPGVFKVEYLERRDREALPRLATPASGENQGVAEALQRSRVLCLFKDTHFRPPGEPTLLLVDERGEVLGREIVPGEAPPSREERRFAFLGKDFVLFADRKPEGRLRFVLPPVPFPELDAIPRLERVVSASPDTPQDEYLRERLGVPKGSTYASILVGYEVRNP